MNKWKYCSPVSKDSILSNHKERSMPNHIDLSIKSFHVHNVCSHSPLKTQQNKMCTPTYQNIWASLVLSKKKKKFNSGNDLMASTGEC